MNTIIQNCLIYTAHHLAIKKLTDFMILYCPQL